MNTTRLLAACTLGLASMAALADAEPAKAVAGALVATNGMTLYTFDKDSADKSACNGPCAALWPPLMAASTDQPQGAYGILTRDDGGRQWSYKGRPLYFYKSDVQPGDRTGDNFKEVWHIVKE
jgi:predicted lipoprotein with Yx(FWY)xxD motif